MLTLTELSRCRIVSGVGGAGKLAIRCGMFTVPSCTWFVLCTCTTKAPSTSYRARVGARFGVVLVRNWRKNRDVRVGGGEGRGDADHMVRLRASGIPPSFLNLFTDLLMYFF